MHDVVNGWSRCGLRESQMRRQAGDRRYCNSKQVFQINSPMKWWNCMWNADMARAFQAKNGTASSSISKFRYRERCNHSKYEYIYM